MDKAGRKLSNKPQWWNVAAILLLFPLGAHAQCGSESIQVKDLSDADTAFLSDSVYSSSVIQEGLLPKDSPRRLVQVAGTIIGYKLEADGDIHCVFTDSNETMIVEFPNPKCPEVMKSSRYAQIKSCREWLLVSVKKPTPKMQKCNLRVAITGQQFIDKLHGQAGCAPNGVEIHPALEIVEASE
jgi:hypothetical protein